MAHSKGHNYSCRGSEFTTAWNLSLTSAGICIKYINTNTQRHMHRHTHTQRHTHAQTLKIIVFKKYFKRPSTQIKSGILKLSAFKDTLHASSSIGDGGLVPTQPLDEHRMTRSLMYVCFL